RERANEQDGEVERNFRELPPVGIEEDDQAAEQRDDERDGSHSGPADGGSEREFAACSGAPCQTHGADRILLALADVAHGGISDDEQKEENGAIDEIKPDSGAESAGGNRGNAPGYDVVDRRDYEPQHGANAQAGAHRQPRVASC